VGVVRHRLGRQGRGRPVIGFQVASAGMGHLPAHPGQVRPAGRRTHAGSTAAWCVRG
jgi:hypothetical protein